MKVSRRTFIAATAMTPVACSVPLSYERGIPVAQPQPTPIVRPPKVGQEWTYVQRNVFDGKTLGLITERVASVGSSIVIERTDESGGRFSNEVQGPWGMVITDPHWERTVTFNPPIPLWPQELLASWSKQTITKYSLAGYPDSSYQWQVYMGAHGWEQINVPAGSFLTLRYQNLINYQSEDGNKVNCIRKETIWFAPSIGRWVARESSGSYMILGVLVPFLEDSYHWQLTSYK
jgi:hypothetical protein